MLGVLLLAGPSPLFAQAYPDRPVTVIVNSAAGGPIDAVARIMSDEMSAFLGQPIVIENRPGAGGMVGAEAVSKADPDGYTILLSGAGPTVIAPALYSSVPYDPLEDFEHVNLATYLPGIFAINPDIPATTLQDFVELARENPGKYNYASSGIGTPSHLAGEMLNLLAGIDLMHIPYRGSPEGIAAVIAGEASMYPAGGSTGLIPAGENGQLRLLAHTGLERLEAAPDVPTMAEAGMPDLAVPSWIGLFAPRGTPKEIVDILDEAALHTLDQPKVQQDLTNVGVAVLAQNAAEEERLHREDLEKWKELVQQMGIEVE